MLWVYWTTPLSAIEEIPYFLEMTPSYRIAHYLPDGNDDILKAESDLLEKRREITNLRAVAYKQCSAWYYNSKVNNRMFKARDLVLKRVMQNMQELNIGVLGPN